MCRYVWTRCLLPPHTHTHTRVKRVRAGKMRRVCKRGDGAALRFAQESQAFAGRWTCVQLVHSRSPNGSGSRSRAALRPPRARILRFVLLRSVRNFESAHVNFTPSQIHKHTECILRYENKAHYVQIELFLHTCTCRASLNSSL